MNDETTLNADWCVRLSPDNNRKVIEWGATYKERWRGNANYYGLLNGKARAENSPWGKLLTTEEFYEKIGLKPAVKRGDELIAEAKKRYPHGTQFISAGNASFAANHINTLDVNDAGVYTYFCDKQDEIDAGFNKGYLYYKGKWAEVVSESKSRFVVGKWYKNLGDRKDYIAKYAEKPLKKDSVDGDFWLIEYIYDKKYQKDPGYGWLKSKDAIECPIEEIQQYLPEGHSDKMSTKTQERFKVGDWVRRVKDIWADMKPGDVDRILDTFGNTHFTLENHEGSHDASCFVKAESHEIPNQKPSHKFKVGDWVWYDGNEVRIKKVDDSGVPYLIELQDSKTTRWVQEDKLIKVVERKTFRPVLLKDSYSIPVPEKSRSIISYPAEGFFPMDLSTEVKRMQKPVKLQRTKTKSKSIKFITKK